MCKNTAVAIAALTFLVVNVLMATAFCATGSLQQSTSLIDTSDAGSPVAISGTVTLKDTFDSSRVHSVESFETNLYATNYSSKGIALLLFTVSTTGARKIDLHVTRSEDYFFQSEMFEPNSTLKLGAVSGPFGDTKSDTVSTTVQLRAAASVIFVQFIDGSTWGDSAAAAEVLHERQQTIDKLKTLTETYRNKEERQFLAELNEPSQLHVIRYLQNLYRTKGKDTNSIMAVIARMVEQSELHRRLAGSSTQDLSHLPD